MSLGARLKKFRQKAGMTQQQLAIKCGWATPKHTKKGTPYIAAQIRISTYERDKYEPSLNDLVTLAKVFKISIHSLIDNK